MKTKTTICALMAVLLTASMTGCGKQSETEPVETEPAIVARQETLATTANSETNKTKTTEAADETTEPASETEGDKTPKYVLSDDSLGIELAQINLADKTITVKTGDSLNDVMTDTGLQYIEWSMTYVDNAVLDFYGKGYALHDVSKEKDLPEGYYPTEISFMVGGEDDIMVETLEGDKAQYRIAAIKSEADDENKYEYTVTFAEGVTAGMTREEIEKALGTTEGSDNSLYLVGDDLALYIDYNFDGKAESIYAFPQSLIKHTPDLHDD